MRLHDLLGRGRILVPLNAGSLAEAVDLLIADPAPSSGDPARSGVDLLAEVRKGTAGSLRRVSPVATVIRLAPVAEGQGDGAGWASLGVAGAPVPAGDREEADPGPRIVLVVRPERQEDARGGSLEPVVRALRDPAVEERILAAGSPEAVLGIRRLVDAEILSALRVEHIFVPLTYRVYPETSLAEIVDLMARKGLQALPVVGRDMQVLGMVTAEAALRHALLRRGRGKESAVDEPAPATARDVMSRSVMCVSESQEVADAARIMVSKEAGQLPVIRDGEIVGVLTRDAVLGALFGDR